MSSRKTEIIRQRIAKMFREAAGTTMYGQIKKVDEVRRTCVVKIGNIEYDEVMLYAIDKEELTGHVMIPTIGSQVLLSRIHGTNRLYVSMFSQLDKIISTKDDFKFSLTEKGFTLTNGEFGLKKTLVDLLSALEKLTVTTGLGPSGVPINIQDFTEIKDNLNNYMEE